MRRRRRRNERDKAWLRWAILGFLVLAFFGGMRQGHDGKNSVVESLTTTGQQISNSTQVNFSEFKNKVFPNYGSELRIKETVLGKGDIASCGQEARIAYQAYDIKGNKLEDSADNEYPLTFRIGGGEVLPVFEQSVIGMMPGGVRSVLAQPSMAYGARQDEDTKLPRNEAIRFDITLLSAAPSLPDPEKTPYRIAVVHSGNGSPLLCGQQAKVLLTIWGLDGTKLYSNKGGEALVFTPGKGEVFFGLEQGVIGMSASEAARTLIVPPAFQKSYGEGAPILDFSFPKGETVLVDVETVP